MKKIKKHKDLQKLKEQIREALPRPPFSAHITLHPEGDISISDTNLQPEEALELGKFLVKFYS